jgi:hypothetical protein
MKFGVMLIAALLFSVSIASVSEAQGLCRESCYIWCKEHRDTQRCRDDCVGRESCKNRKLNKAECRDWCAKNKPGVQGCLDDCKGYRD